MAEMVATLSDACEREFGFMATRLFRVFKNDEIQGDITVFGFMFHVMTLQSVLTFTIKQLLQSITVCNTSLCNKKL